MEVIVRLLLAALVLFRLRLVILGVQVLQVVHERPLAVALLVGFVFFSQNDRMRPLEPVELFG